MKEEERRVVLEMVRVEKPETANVILGQAHFIETIDDLHLARLDGPRDRGRITPVPV